MAANPHRGRARQPPSLPAFIFPCAILSTLFPASHFLGPWKEGIMSVTYQMEHPKATLREPIVTLPLGVR
ncbi:hypothetical protein E2C01_001214 [Portunus trituberculatus]|uniref:Uncharacterized protein n=1 Tax=Portunus trituberculatus TaxID=210409 RepID=A0A5B7CIV4_PORTR|nr:hypothetical protein [Portunus trituberculatus]